MWRRLFYKIGKFYELYEDDAQIGADHLGWKLTHSGVGHCRQVPGSANISTNICRFSACTTGYETGCAFEPLVVILIESVAVTSLVSTDFIFTYDAERIHFSLAAALLQR